MTDYRRYSILVLGLLSLVFLVLLGQLVAENWIPMDWDIFQSAVTVWDKGGNPYNVTELKAVTGHDYPYRYPYITLWFFKALSPMSHVIWWTLFSVIIFVIMFFVDKNLDWILFFVLLTSGYMTLFKNYTIGNIGVVDMLCFVVIFYLIIREKYIYASILLGVSAIFKTVPLVYCLIFLLLPIKWYKRVGLMIVSFMALAWMEGISYILNPKLSQSFYHLLFFGYPVLDARGFFNPSSMAVLKDFLGAKMWLFAYVPYVIIIFTFLILIWYKTKPDTILMISLGILAIMLVIPELKHYSYIMAIIPTYFLLKNQPFWQRFIMVAFICVVPLAVYMGYLFAEAMGLAFGTIFDWFYSYTPFFVLLITYFILGYLVLNQKDYIEINMGEINV